VQDKVKTKSKCAKANLEILSYRYNLPAGNVVAQPQANLKSYIIDPGIPGQNLTDIVLKQQDQQI
jgi:hypothetical protein